MAEKAQVNVPAEENNENIPEKYGNAKSAAKPGDKDELDAKDGLEIWKQHKKHILVFSNSGKPVYTRYGNESTLSSMFGLLQAIAASTSEALRVVRTPKQTFVFLIKDPIYMVCIYRTGEPVAYVERQLSYIHAHILFHITMTALVDAYRRKPNFDLRGLWGGENIKGEVAGLLQMAHYSPMILLDAVPTLYLPFQVRNAASETLHTLKQSNLLYAVLIADKKVITTVSPKKHPMNPRDLILLINFVDNAKQLRSQETWTPLCLPAFNSTGFLHAYAAFISQSICLILLSGMLNGKVSRSSQPGESLEQFHYCSMAKEKVRQSLEENQIIMEVELSLSQPKMNTNSCNAAAAIHLLYRCAESDEYFETSIASHAPLFQTERKRLIRRYAEVQDRASVCIGNQEFKKNDKNSVIVNVPNISPTSPVLHPNSDDAGKLRRRKNDKENLAERRWTLWDVGITDAVLSICTAEYELYATFHPYATPVQANTCVNRFLDWKRKESDNLFVAKKQTW